MIQNAICCLFAALLVVACSPSEELEHSTTTEEVPTENPICFNHSLLVLDSATYFAAVNSEFLHEFAFAEERQLEGYKGFYLFGQTNYIELFHPNSFEGNVEAVGGMWVCHASLKAHHLEQLNRTTDDCIDFESDELFQYYSLVLNDSVEPIISAWEMQPDFYESWTKKSYHDSLVFLPVDYNSPADTDSAAHYVMKDVSGIGLSVTPADSAKVVTYLQEIGYTSATAVNGQRRMSNNDQFIELQVSDSHHAPTINCFYIELNQTVEPANEVIGHSKLVCERDQAIWYFGLE